MGSTASIVVLREPALPVGRPGEAGAPCPGWDQGRGQRLQHKVLSYRRMKEKEGQVAAEVAELLRKEHEVDDVRTAGTAGKSVGMSCWRNRSSGRVGYRG